MTTVADILPHTLEYRNTLRQALKNQNITVQESKTRNFSGSMYALSRDFKLDLSMSFRQYRVLRTVTFVVSTPEGRPGGPLLDQAIDELKIWFTLCGKQLDIEYNRIDNGMINWKIVSTCVLI